MGGLAVKWLKKKTIFWDMIPCTVVEVDHHSGGITRVKE
jgi:hypothetical protein